MIAAFAILAAPIGVGLVVLLLDHVGEIEIHTISTRDFPNIVAEREAAPLPQEEAA